jgi:DNA mismatch repair ATPase MutS
VVGLVLYGIYGKRAQETFTWVFSRQPLFHQHAELFARIAGTRMSSPHLRELQARLAASGLTAAREMAALDRLKRLSDLRYQALFHFPVNALTLWDFYVIARLERWQRRAGEHLREWFAILGEVDALAAIGSLAHDNPEWTFPRVSPDADRVAARGLGHPLLPDAQRVVNDVEVGPPGSLLLVTGSNMSGKSTLLRSIGVNVVLAQMGAPVCAEDLSMPPLAVYTSMRVQDSLEAGVSYFMAALQRLKFIVEAARRSPHGAPRLMYLLDEILQGTNTAERQVAVRHILGHLLALPVIGAVTTHDLELGSSPELVQACRSVHFTEGVEDGEEGARLSFDYKLRPGVATSRNALKLLRLVGLDT